MLGRVLLLLLTAAGVAGALPAAAASIRWSTAGGGPQGGDVVGERLEGLALARARSELVRRVLELPLEGGASVGQWAARALSRDCALREWLRRQPPHGAPRRYAGGVVEVDVRLAADELALKLVALSRAPGGAGRAAAGAEAPILSAGEAARAADGWADVWATGTAAAGEVPPDRPPGWLDIGVGGVELTRRAAGADALHSLLERVSDLRVSPAVRVREFLASDPSVEQAVFDGLAQRAAVDVELTDAQLALGAASIGLPELVRLLSDVCGETYQGERFRPEDFREMLLMGQPGELLGEGLATPPEAYRTVCPQDAIGVDAPSWADKTLRIVERCEPGGDELHPLDVRAARARCAALDELTRQLGRLALDDGRSVQDVLDARPELRGRFEQALAGVRVLRTRFTAAGAAEVELALPLRRLWMSLAESVAEGAE